MLNKTTVNQLHDLRLKTMAAKLVEQEQSPQMSSLSFDERLAFLVDAEHLARYARRTQRLITQAGFRFPAVIEDIDYTAKRGLTRQDVMRLSDGAWLRRKKNLFVCGPTGVGKTYLAGALGCAACRQGIPVKYFRVQSFFAALDDARQEGRFNALHSRLSAVPLLILDDWRLRKFTLEESHCLMELFERRYDAASTVIAGQLPFTEWHGLFPDPTLADAILDRIVHNAEKYSLSGESMRKKRSTENNEE